MNRLGTAGPELFKEVKMLAVLLRNNVYQLFNVSL